MLAFLALSSVMVTGVPRFPLNGLVWPGSTLHMPKTMSNAYIIVAPSITCTAR